VLQSHEVLEPLVSGPGLGAPGSCAEANGTNSETAAQTEAIRLVDMASLRWMRDGIADRQRGLAGSGGTLADVGRGFDSNPDSQ